MSYEANRRSAGLILAVAACAAFLVRAGESPADDAWIRLDSEHFSFISARDETTTWELARDLEELRAMLIQLFPSGTYDEPVPSYFFIFDSAAQDKPYRLGASDAAGFFQATPLGNYAALFKSEGEHAERSVQQQYLHALIRLNQPAAPAWLRHGLATFYGTFERDETGSRFGQPIVKYLQWLRDFSGGRWMPIETLISLEAPPTNSTGSVRFHAQSWILVHYLLTGSGAGEAGLVHYMEKITEGASSRVAFTETIAADSATLLESLTEYAGATSFRFLRYGGGLAAGGDTTVRAAALSPAEVHALLGELVVATQPEGGALASAHLEAALRLAPENPRAHAGQARLAVATGDLDRAIRHLHRASRASPRDPHVGFLLGDTLLARLGNRPPADDSGRVSLGEAVAALERATELAPAFAEAWARLGFALGLDEERSREAIAALERAAALLPGRVDIAWNLLLAHAHAGQRLEAELVVEKLKRLEAPAATLARARETLVQMAYREAAALVRETRLEEALPLLARVLAETTDPELRESVETLVPKLIPVAQHNAFAARYLEALDLLRQGARDASLEGIEALESEATSERQREALAVLRAAAGGGV